MVRFSAIATAFNTVGETYFQYSKRKRTLNHIEYTQTGGTLLKLISASQYSRIIKKGQEINSAPMVGGGVSFKDMSDVNGS